MAENRLVEGCFTGVSVTGLRSLGWKGFRRPATQILLSYLNGWDRSNLPTWHARAPKGKARDLTLKNRDRIEAKNFSARAHGINLFRSWRRPSFIPFISAHPGIIIGAVYRTIFSLRCAVPKKTLALADGLFGKFACP